MTTNQAAAAFAVPPKGTFPIMAGGVPAVIGPWLFRITADRNLVTMPVHQLQVTVDPYPAGSARMGITWSYVNGRNETRIHATNHVMPRPTDGTHLGKVLVYLAEFDAYGEGRSRRGKVRKGITYFLTVTHLYQPHADQTVNGLWERHLAEAKAADDELSVAAQAINVVRTMLRKPPN